MNKLTAQQILEIAEKNWSNDNFGEAQWSELEDDSVVTIDQEKVEQVQKAKDDFWKEIEPKLPNSNRVNDPLFKQWQNMPSRYEESDRQILEQLGLGKVVTVEDYGGEGKGSDYYSVKHFVDHDVYIRTDGWYASYEGGTYDNGYGYEVRPTEKTVIVYI
jgi:hypothetical protein